MLIFFGTMSLLSALMQCIMYLECINIDVGMFGKVFAGIQILDTCATLPLVCLVLLLTLLHVIVHSAY